MVWRRSLMYLALPLVFISAMIGLVNMVGKIKMGPTYNGLGNILTLLSGIDSLLLFVCALFAAYKWHFLPLSMKVMGIGWALATVLPLLPAFFPLEAIIQESELEEYLEDTEGQAILFAFKMSLAIGYAVTLLPLLVTISGGALQGALRIIGMFPTMSLAGWTLLINVPYNSLLFFVILVIIIQVLGNWMLLFGSLLFIASPWVYILRRSDYVGVYNKDKTDDRMVWNHRIACLCTLSGAMMMLLWALTSEVSGYKVLSHYQDPAENGDNEEVHQYLLSYGEALRIVFEAAGRIILTTLISCDWILRITLTEWGNENLRRENEEHNTRTAAIYQDMDQMSLLLTRNRKKGDAQNKQAPEEKENAMEDIEQGTGEHDACAPDVKPTTDPH